MYKKRRVQKSLNKNEQKIRRNTEDGRPLSSYFRQVQRLTLNFQSFSKHGHLIQEDNFEFGPQDIISFSMPCLGGCGDGKVDFQKKIESAVQGRVESGEGRSQCQNQLFSTEELCGCEVKCEFQISYAPQSAPSNPAI